MEEDSIAVAKKGKRPTQVADGARFPRARRASQKSEILAARHAMATEAYVVPTTDEDGWTADRETGTGLSFVQRLLWTGGALAVVCAGAMAFHMALASEDSKDGTSVASVNESFSDADRGFASAAELPRLAEEARQFLDSLDVRERHRIHSVRGAASALQIAGIDYLLQPVTLADGIRRTAYFAITGEGLEFDLASFVGDSDQRWSTVARGNAVAEAGESAEGGERKMGDRKFGPCRLYVRPADYYNFGFSAPDDFMCFKLDDADRQFAVYGYARRDSAVAREMERIFGEDSVSSPTGLATSRRWTAHSLTLELSIPEYHAPNQFLIERILSDSWLLTAVSQQN